ncbi:Type 1 glutamine amidotransferase-like domain-containing protein [Microbacterium sp. KUDC0406]|uniref:Type 1 glutamine amidotransferase-like domain-containing protein n=1 Tax=Microbacterium sp. KUDC0406 TaxID=2909588 RepID=UPI001F1A4081|nr:Type 1 glutamine amidotransferase-like domain-containing protein [Microbacterium sp. KUDC0406]UJP11412.1 Type 1 glutamine amidotransferase-like domain-containing protein [Microbacterium sp. KUDC0406]
MGVHLVGGGFGRAAFAPFTAEALAAAPDRTTPVVVVVTVREDGGTGHARDLIDAVTADGAASLDIRLVAVAETDRVDPAMFDGVHAIVIGGGLTPAYHSALEPSFDRIRTAVGNGTPYLGFSAGAMIAAERAILGGWRIGGVPVVPEDTAEDLEEVTVVPGIGLVDVSVDVHVAQWGTLARLIAATEAGATDGGVGIDESTALIAGADGLRIAGEGSVWRVSPAEGGVIVSSGRGAL